MLHNKLVVGLLRAIALFVFFPLGLVVVLRLVKTVFAHPFDFYAGLAAFAFYIYSFFYCFLRWGMRQKVKPFLPWRRDRKKQKK
jgi:hypothetical protein